MVRPPDNNMPVGGIPSDPDDGVSKEDSLAHMMATSGIDGEAVPDTSIKEGGQRTVDHVLIPQGLKDAVEDSGVIEKMVVGSVNSAIQDVKNDLPFGEG